MWQKVVIIVLVGIVIVGCSQSTPAVKPKPYFGLAGFVPRNFPDFSPTDLSEMWKEINSSADLYGVHVDWKDTRLITAANQSLAKDLVVVLGWQDPLEWRSSVDSLLQTIDSVVKPPSRVKYLGIGNEVNSLKEKYPDKFDDYLVSYKAVYQAVKSKYPHLAVFPTFQYEFLQGKGYLSGTHTNTWEIVNELESFTDLFVFTTYPYFDYKSPSDIPTDYFDSIANYTSKPIAISETGWMSRQSFGGKFKSLSEQGYAGSEQEQAEYLGKLREILPKSNVEFVNWAFLHDISKWEEGDEPSLHPLFDSIALKRNDGTPKLAWEEWQKFFR